MGTSAETVSVIVPCYRQEKTLAACLDAVFAQTRPPDEVIVVDDASADASTTIARRYPCRLIVQPTNRGVSAARNAGAGAARGSVLFFVDSDIALAPQAIAAALHELAVDQEAGLVQGIYDREPLFVDGRVEICKTLWEHFWRRTAAGPVTVTLFALTAIRREVFAETGGFDESLRDGEDVEFGTRLPARWRVRMSAAVVGRHDDVDRLRPMLREQYRRATGFAANLVRGRRRGSSGTAAARTNALSPGGVLSTAAALAGTPLAAGCWVVGWPPLTMASLVLPVLAVAAFLLANRALLRFVAGERGAAFTGYFAIVHFMLTAATVVGTAVGVTRLLHRPAVRENALIAPGGAR